jgi:hypothetical protein
VFSLRYGWYELSEEKVKELTMYDLSWDYFGKYYSSLKSQEESSVGNQNNFFCFRVYAKKVDWTFRIRWSF